MESEEGVRVAVGTLHHAGSLVSSEPRELGTALRVAEINGAAHALHVDVWHRIEPPLRKYVVHCEIEIEAVDRDAAEYLATDLCEVGHAAVAKTASRCMVRATWTEQVEKVKRFPCRD